MTCNTSAVAVCCSKASRVSVMSRAFSIAMTACAAKFCSSAICLSENGRGFLAVDAKHALQGALFAQSNAEQATTLVALAPINKSSCGRMARAVKVCIHDICDMDNILAADDP